MLLATHRAEVERVSARVLAIATHVLCGDDTWLVAHWAVVELVDAQVPTIPTAILHNVWAVEESVVATALRATVRLHGTENKNRG